VPAAEIAVNEDTVRTILDASTAALAVLGGVMGFATGMAATYLAFLAPKQRERDELMLKALATGFVFALPFATAAFLVHL